MSVDTSELPVSVTVPVSGTWAPHVPLLLGASTPTVSDEPLLPGGGSQKMSYSLRIGVGRRGDIDDRATVLADAGADRALHVARPGVDDHRVLLRRPGGVPGSTWKKK